MDVVVITNGQGAYSGLRMSEHLAKSLGLEYKPAKVKTKIRRPSKQGTVKTKAKGKT